MAKGSSRRLEERLDSGKVIARSKIDRRAGDRSIEHIPDAQIENNNLYLALVKDKRFSNMHGGSLGYLAGLSVLDAIARHYSEHQRRYSDRGGLITEIMENIERLRGREWSETSETMYKTVDENIFNNPQKPYKDNILGVLAYRLMKLRLIVKDTSEKRELIRTVGNEALTGIRNINHNEKAEAPYIFRSELVKVYLEQYQRIVDRLYYKVEELTKDLSKDEKNDVLS